MNTPEQTKPMSSVEKAHTLLEQLVELDDTELAEAFPIPVPASVVRSTLAFVAPHIPEDPAELDGFLDGVAGLCVSLKSDAPAV